MSPSRRALVFGALALGLLLALILIPRLDCGPDGPSDPEAPAPDEVEESGPPPMSPGTLRYLGPHVWDASLDLRGDRAGLWPSTETVAKLEWADIDRSLYEVVQNDRLQRVIRVGSQVWRLNAHDGKYRLTHDAAGNTIIFQRTLQLWDQALSGFTRQLAWRRVGNDTVDGRPCVVWRLELAPPPALDSTEPLPPDAAASRLGLPTEPLSLSGTVYVDEATGNRLLAEIEGRFVGRAYVGARDPTDEVHVTYRERRSLTAVPPTVEPPDAEDVFVPRRPRPGSGRR